MNTTLLFTSLFVGLSSFSQTPDSVVLGPGYANESYYNINTGEVLNVSNSGWDLTFDLSAYGGAIRLNRKYDQVYLYPGTTADWATLDTAGYQSWNSYIDGYNSWSEGALNACANPGIDTDMGWGEYNTITHITTGSRLFVIKLQDNSFRKLHIQSLSAGVYSFRYANIDGTNEVSETITKADYSGKNFIHYSILNQQIIEREPLSSDWQLVFTNYVLELAPGYFSGVTGVLANTTFKTNQVAEVNNLPSPDATPDDAIFSDTVSTIGYDWKWFNSGTFTYEIVDSLAYFVQDEAGNIWKLIFTGFGGSSTGKILFTKQQITFAKIENQSTPNLFIYPNPASEFIFINEAEELVSIHLYSNDGRLIEIIQVTPNTSMFTIPVAQFEAGKYIIEMHTNTDRIIVQTCIITH